MYLQIYKSFESLVPIKTRTSVASTAGFEKDSSAK